MSDEFREKAIKIIVDYSGASADELKSMADADLLAKYCEITGESADDYKNAQVKDNEYRYP